jgi:hypothetical protein
MKWLLSRLRRLPAKPMSLALDGLFPHDYPRGSGGYCRIRAFADPGRPTVVVATELADSPGKSITYGAEDLAMAVCRRLDLDPSNLRWVEQKPGRLLECLAWVDFGPPVDGRFKEYWWRGTTKKAVERVIGQSLADRAGEGESDDYRNRIM